MSIFWTYMRFRMLLWLLRAAWRLFLAVLLAAVLVAAAPLTLVAAVRFAGAWLRGWPPARLRRAAGWALPMTGVYLAGRALQARTWQALALAPVRDWATAWHAVSLGQVVTAFVLCAPVAVPAGLLAASLLWGWRIYAVETGLSGRTATAPVVFDARQWRRQAAAARARAAAPGAVPLTDAHSRIVAGPVIRAVGHRCRPLTWPWCCLMVETGAGPAAYYADVMQAAITLAVTAPPGPPASGTDFLERLDAAWLQHAYTGDPPRLAAVTAARPHLADIALRYRTLLARLGPALDGPGTLADADAWYFVLEGTREPSVAEAQAMALTELVAHAATSRATEPRAMLLACDDYSAVSGRVPLWQLYERGRSLGIGVQVSAQSWHGLAGTDDERHRIAATADGGIWLLKTPEPEQVCQLAGTRRGIETATKVIGGMWGDEGSSRIQHAWTVDPGIVRRLQVGQAAYVASGGCTWVQVARPRSSPLPLPAPVPAPRPAVVIPPAHPDEQCEPGPEQAAPESALDDVFGQGAGP